MHFLVIFFKHLAFLFVLFEISVARVGFVKDQSTTRIKFPPLIQKLPHGIPTGHLRPFGKLFIKILVIYYDILFRMV